MAAVTLSGILAFGVGFSIVEDDGELLAGVDTPTEVSEGSAPDDGF